MATSKVASAKKTSANEAGLKRTEIHTAAQPVVNVQSIDAAPLLYADSLIQIGFGPFVTKCTFGTQQSPTSAVNAVLTLALPTNAMIELAKHILTVAGANGQEEKIGEIYSSFQSNLKSLSKQL